MRKYNGSIVIKFDTDATGNAGSGKKVTVYNTGTIIKSTLFEDDGTTPLANPVTADDNGNYSFTVGDGIYDLVIDEGLPSQNRETKVQIFDGSGVSNLGNFSTVAIISTGAYSVIGETIQVTDRGNGYFIINSGGTPDGMGVLDAGNGNTAVVDKEHRLLSASWYGAVSGDIATRTNDAINNLDDGAGSSTGGVIEIIDFGGALEGTIRVDSTAPFSVDSLKLCGKGMQTSLLVSDGFVGGGVELGFSIYSHLCDFGVKDCVGSGIAFDDVDGAQVGFSNVVERVLSVGNTLDGILFERSFMTTVRNCEFTSNNNAGCRQDFKVHTSFLFECNWARVNLAAGFRSEYAVYSAYIANGADENQNGYHIFGNRGVGFLANGAEFSKRAGFLFESDASHQINWVSTMANFAVDNNKDDLGFANHTHLLAADNIVNFVAQKQPVSEVATQAGTRDFYASGRGAVMSLEDPLMLNQGPRAENDAFIQINRSSPELVYEFNFTALQSRTLVTCKNQNGLTADWSGELLITVSNSAFGDPSSVGTATYKLLVSQSLEGPEESLIASLGLVNGTSPSHPSFEFTAFAGGIFAKAVSTTAGNFWFAVEKVSGNLIFT